MEWMQFVTGLIQAIVWPLVAVLLILTIGWHAPTLFGLLSRRQHFEPPEDEWLEIIREGEREIKQEVERLSVTSRNQSLPVRLRAFAKASPKAAVNTAFEEVELLLRDLAPVPNASVVEKTHSTRELAQLAQKHGKISPVDERAISVLRFFRDTVAGSSETLSYTSALEFLIFADGVMATLEERRE